MVALPIRSSRSEGKLERAAPTKRQKWKGQVPVVGALAIVKGKPKDRDAAAPDGFAVAGNLHSADVLDTPAAELVSSRRHTAN